MPKGKKFIADISGQKFYELTAINQIPNKKPAHWQFLCSCGKVVVLQACYIGRTKSCGCLKVKTCKQMNWKHGLTKHPLSHVWDMMRQRCNQPKSWAYKWYGARGIKICSEWDDFKVFYDWAISSGYQKGLTLDRRENNGNYEPSNCRWITQAEQCKNKRQNHKGIKHNRRRVAQLIADGYYQQKEEKLKKKEERSKLNGCFI